MKTAMIHLKRVCRVSVYMTGGRAIVAAGRGDVIRPVFLSNEPKEMPDTIGEAVSYGRRRAIRQQGRAFTKLAGVTDAPPAFPLPRSARRWAGGR